jgi:WD40 repeat protein
MTTKQRTCTKFLVMICLFILLLLLAAIDCVGGGNRHIWVSDKPLYELGGPYIPETLSSERAAKTQEPSILRSVRFSHDGTRLVAVFGWNVLPTPTIEVRLYDVINERLLAAFPGGLSAAIVGDGQSAVVAQSGSEDLLVVSLETGQVQKRLSVGHSEVYHYGMPKIVAGDPNRNIVAVGYGGEVIRLYDLSSGQTLVERDRPDLGTTRLANSPRFMEFDPEGSLLWVCYDSDESIHAFNVMQSPTRWELPWTRVISGEAGTVISDQRRKRLLEASLVSIKMWEFAGFMPPAVVNPRFLLQLDMTEVRNRRSLPVTGVAYDPDEQYYFAYCSYPSDSSRKWMLWDLKEPETLDPVYSQEIGGAGYGQIDVCSERGLLALPCDRLGGSESGICVYEYRRTDRKKEAVVRIKGTEDGAGVVISSTGDILTAAHLVNGASKITVTSLDGRQGSAKFIRSFSGDVALINTSSLSLPVSMPIECRKEPADSQAVLVIGHPTGGRSAVWQSYRGAIVNMRGGVIVTNIPAEHGLSGGPLFDQRDRVVGIVTSRTPDSKVALATAIKAFSSELNLSVKGVDCE